MKKRTKKILGWGCGALAVLGILGFVVFNITFIQGLSSPFLFVS